MGLISAAIGSVAGNLADQWQEFFTCDSLPNDVLVVKGQRNIGSRSSNRKGDDNIISNGSGIVVADGQCALITDQGKIVELCAEPGEYTYDVSAEPSIFAGDIKEAVSATLTNMLDRFKRGGEPGRDQRIYYFNIKEIMDNKFGTTNPILFRTVDRNISMDLDVSIRFNGVYSYKITNPILFYSNVCGNIDSAYTKDVIDSQLKTEFVNALQPAVAKLSNLEIRPSMLPAHVGELCTFMNEELTKLWAEKRGISVVSIAMNPVTLTPEDDARIKAIQDSARLVNPDLARATLAQATADTMKDAANNAGGAMTCFMGMNMAQGAVNSALFTPSNPQPAQTAPAADSWKCSCGNTATGKFCPECGSAKPAPAGSWTCSCGAVNTGKFCAECGSPKPASGHKCANCGFETEDGNVKFCPECGTKF